jgi:hypothetical protein
MPESPDFSAVQRLMHEFQTHESDEARWLAIYKSTSKLRILLPFSDCNFFIANINAIPEAVWLLQLIAGSRDKDQRTGRKVPRQAPIAENLA